MYQEDIVFQTDSIVIEVFSFIVVQIVRGGLDLSTESYEYTK